MGPNFHSKRDDTTSTVSLRLSPSTILPPIFFILTMILPYTVGNPCPWCHRVSLTLALAGLQNDVSSTRLVDDPTVARRGGWTFGRSRERSDPVFAADDLYGVYEAASPGFRGRCTAPLLVDKVTKRIVSNESRDIIKMLNALAVDLRRHSGGESPAAAAVDLRPAPLVAEIDAASAWIFEKLNNGVYRCGFATSQAAYDKAAADVREGLEMVEAQLEATAQSLATKETDEGALQATRFLLSGQAPTEADVVLLPTILRFDAAYATLFRAGGGQLRVRDFPRLDAWLKACWALEGVPETIDLEDALGSYYKQLFPLNPGGLVPSLPTPKDLGLGLY